MYRSVFELDIGATKSHVRRVEAFENIIENKIALAPRPINVKIGWRLSVFVQKTFKIQVKFYGANIGNTKAITHNAVGAAATAHVHKTTRF